MREPNEAVKQKIKINLIGDYEGTKRPEAVKQKIKDLIGDYEGTNEAVKQKIETYWRQ